MLSLITAVPIHNRRGRSFRRKSRRFCAAFRHPRLVIARDNDSEGERAAERLARRCAHAGIEATVIVPERGDFNDDLVASHIRVSRTPGPFGHR